MKAVRYHAFKAPLTIEEVPDPAPKPHGAVIRVTATGLCRSDWHGWMGHDPDIVLPHIPGHELAGIVEAVGAEVRNFRPGDRVTVPFVCGCGQCPQCRSGNQQVCDFQSQPGFTHWGSFAQYVALDYVDTNLVLLPGEIPDIAAASLGCRFVTAFRALVDQGGVREGQYVAIHGCGGLGLAAVQIATAYGAHVIAVDIRREALAKALELGALASINATEVPEVPERIRDLSGGGAHLSLDALGSSETCLNSIACLRKRGKHIQVGLMVGEDRAPHISMDRILADELEILGSHGMQAHRYPELLEMIQTGRLNPGALVEKTITLEEAATALPEMGAYPQSGIWVIDSF